MKLKIKPCPIVEQDHRKSLRAYAHWNHKPNTICISKAIYDLPLNHSLALLAHETGHAINNGGSEEEANEPVQDYTEAAIIYIQKTPWGNRLQYISDAYLERVYKWLTAYVERSSLKSFRPPR